jgi:hypothetical protein
MFPETSIMSYFADIEDPRSGQKTTHPLIDIVIIAILGVICGQMVGLILNIMEMPSKTGL